MAFWKRKKKENPEKGVLDSLRNILDSIRRATAGENIFLEPIEAGEAIIVPIVSCRVSIGSRQGSAGQGLGGGASAFPTAFLVLDSKGTRVIGFDTIELELANLLDGEALNSALQKLHPKKGDEAQADVKATANRDAAVSTDTGTGTGEADAEGVRK
ncbi:MAG: hypothetical protein CVV64_08570 [Candidatus Wallbacteria bacterium HGW-Wallbacteria-1]|jgi:uncharacterized spore protein YtfJ|uniref:Sporulation protein n=1 Tax=Candidatus Wallbacteria bacterium HGW-Wallbacteria-1 TaxID=2013854 RepID=A0A2N1PPZ2_9BACT|nr:MAG: hypothetical protein CVV64_08570 [Candidatus Wallbacteria bacterium HGW-Wallbacteria-1]